MKNSAIVTLLFAFSFYASWGQNVKQKPAEKFLEFVNSYQIDSLQVLVTEDFKLIRTYTPYGNDKKSFINEYIPASKNFNGKYNVLEINENGLVTEFLVEDQSDYLRYLTIDYPKWKITITRTDDGKISIMTIDPTESYETYLSEVKRKSKDFENWRIQKYPEETEQALYSTAGLLMDRLKEYSKV